MQAGQSSTVVPPDTGATQVLKYAWIYALLLLVGGRFLFEPDSGFLFIVGQTVAGLILGAIVSPSIWAVATYVLKRRWKWHSWLNAICYFALLVQLFISVGGPYIRKAVSEELGHIPVTATNAPMAPTPAALSPIEAPQLGPPLSLPAPAVASAPITPESIATPQTESVAGALGPRPKPMPPTRSTAATNTPTEPKPFYANLLVVWSGKNFLPPYEQHPYSVYLDPGTLRRGTVEGLPGRTADVLSVTFEMPGPSGRPRGQLKPLVINTGQWSISDSVCNRGKGNLLAHDPARGFTLRFEIENSDEMTSKIARVLCDYGK